MNSNSNSMNVNTDVLVTEVPSSLKQLARLVVRGFYSIEDALIIDMLVRNPCMKEEDICEMLKFEKKMLRSRITILKNDKFIQTKLRMETGVDGKAQRANYYFINYKTFVNVIKYKLDMMRKRMETEERDATSRASFKCTNCMKTYTDLEADQLFDFNTGEFNCTFCFEVVEEDASALPKKDSRLLLAKFNEQMEPLFLLLREVEGIKLAPEVLEPEPVDMSKLKGLDGKRDNRTLINGTWSGEATRRQNLYDETQTKVTINEDNTSNVPEEQRKETPIWMTESTIMTNAPTDDLTPAFGARKDAPGPSTGQKSDYIMNVLLQHEKPSAQSSFNSGKSAVRSIQEQNSDSDSDNNEPTSDLNQLDQVSDHNQVSSSQNVETIDDNDDGDGDDDDDDMAPFVTIGDKRIRLTDINDAIISEMTPEEKLAYVQIYQDYYSHIYD